MSNEGEKELDTLHQSLELTYNFISKNLDNNNFNEGNLGLLFSIEIYDIETRKFILIENLLESCLNNSYLTDIIKNIIDLNPNEGNELLLKEINLTLVTIRSQISLIENELTILTEELSKLELVKIANQKKLNSILDEEYKLKSKVELGNLIELIDSIKSYSDELAKIKTIKLKVSNKKKQAEKELINDEYLQKFKSHLDSFRLPKREKIARISRIEAGKSIIESNIEGHKLEGILSEGEAKVHAICDWFAELEVSDSEIAIFDDPITSLDHGNIKILAKNIFSLTKTHQIIVFTHNLEFYNNLVELINGKGNITKSGCLICKDLPDSEKCKGHIKTQNILLKCSSFYQLKHFTSPGFLEPGIPFNSLHFIDRFNKIKLDLETANDSTVDKELRSAINDFVEKHVFADIKKFIFNNNDLITFNKERLGTIEDADFERLKVLHGEISASSGTLHSTEDALTDTFDPRDYIKIYDEIANIINKATGKPSLSLINN
ncbi:hypothetical protein [Adhaeribacter terreus]|uniref:Protein CR006 P-loop domain-containing protein n=1 Tax=Adhaeribacter terreus TaxID=529703 RepID=A0ABW0EHP9_9BACT